MSRRTIREQMASLLEEETPTPVLNSLASNLPAPIERTRRLPASMRAQGLERGDLAGRLEHLSGKALDRIDDILELDIADDEHDKFGEKLRGLNAAAKTVLATQVRVDEHRLRQRNADTLPELLEEIRKYEERMKVPA